MSQKSAHKVSIYFCGGAGLNLGDLFTKAVTDNAIVKERVSSYFIDTSRANNRDTHNDDNLLVVGEQNGSGKRRDLNYQGIKNSVPKILHKFAPGTFNIVVHSAGGGSGSTIANVLTSQLLSDGKPTVVICVGSTDSKKEAQNTLQTLLSYEQISRNAQKPVIVHYKENTPETPRGSIDITVLDNLKLLVLMLACVAEKIDVSDLTHFLDYPKVTDFPATLAGIELYTSNPKLASGTQVYAVTTLATADTSTVFEPLPEYQSAGFLTDSMAQIFSETHLMHWVILGGTLTDAIDRIRTLLDTFKSASKAHKAVVYHTDKDGDCTEDGLMF